MKNKHAQKKFKHKVNLLVRMTKINTIKKLNKKVLLVHQFLVLLINHLRVYLNLHKIKKKHQRNVRSKIIKVKNQLDLEIVLYSNIS